MLKYPRLHSLSLLSPLLLSERLHQGLRFLILECPTRYQITSPGLQWSQIVYILPYLSLLHIAAKGTLLKIPMGHGASRLKLSIGSCSQSLRIKSEVFHWPTEATALVTSPHILLVHYCPDTTPPPFPSPTGLLLPWAFTTTIPATMRLGPPLSQTLLSVTFLTEDKLFWSTWLKERQAAISRCTHVLPHFPL